MAQADFVTRILLENQQFKNEIKDCKRQIKDLKSSANGKFNGLQGFTNSINAAKGGFSGLIGAVGKFGVYGAAIGAVAGAVAEVGKEAIDARKNIENLELNLGTLLGDSQKGVDLVKQLSQYGQKTPYDTEGLAKAAQTMLAYGVSANQIMPLMKELGDVAQGNSEHLNSLALAFGQMTAVGTVQKQDLNQLANAGFGFNQIAKSMGVSVSEFLDMVSKKKVSVNDIAKALHDATSEGGLFYKSAENASRGLEGTFSNFEESLTSVKAQIGKMIEPAAIEMVNGLGTAIEEVTKAFGDGNDAQEAFKVAGQAVGTVIKTVGDTIAVVIKIGREYYSILKSIAQTIYSYVKPALDALNVGMNAILNSFGVKPSNNFRNGILDLIPPIRLAIKALNEYSTLLSKVQGVALGDGKRHGNGLSDQQMRSSQNAAVRRGNGRFGKDKNGNQIFTDNEGRGVGHRSVVRQKDGTYRTGTRQFDYGNSRWYWKYDQPKQKTNNVVPTVTVPTSKVSTPKVGTTSKGGGTTKEEILPKGSIAQLNQELDKLQQKRERLTDVKDIHKVDLAIKAIKDEIENINFSANAIDMPKVDVKDIKPIIVPVKFEIDQDGLEDLNKQIQSMNDDIKKEIEESISNYMSLTDSLSGSVGQAVQDFSTLGKQLQRLNKLSKVKNEDGSKKYELMGDYAVAAANGLALLGAQLQQMGADGAIAKVGSIMAAVGQIILGFAQASVQATSMGPWGWIAFLGAGLAAVATTISTITGFANGGIIQGGSTHGDGLYARVNAGEMILNGSQQRKLFNLLDSNGAIGGAATNVVVTGKIKGSDIFLSQRNYNNKMSKVK